MLVEHRLVPDRAGTTAVLLPVGREGADRHPVFSSPVAGQPICARRVAVDDLGDGGGGMLPVQHGHQEPVVLEVAAAADQHDHGRGRGFVAEMFAARAAAPQDPQ